MIGTILRLGFDATAIQRGLAGLGGLFGRATRQIGIGGLRQVGAQVTDLFGSIAMAIPQATTDLLAWSGTVNDVATQTGVAVKDIIEIGDALEFAGVAAGDGSMMLSRLKDNLFEASKGSEAQKKALNDLGFSAQEFIDMNLVDAFEAIGRRVSEMGPDFKGLEGAMADLFGARAGLQMNRLFSDYDGFMKLARNNTKGLTADNAKMIGAFDKMDEALGRWQTVRRNLAAGLLEGLTGGQGASYLNQTMDSLNGFADSMRAVGASIRNEFGKAIEVISSQGIGASLGDLFTSLGKSIGKGIMESIKESTSIFPVIPKFLNPFASNTGSDGLLKETSKQTTILSRIERKGITATYA